MKRATSLFILALFLLSACDDTTSDQASELSGGGDPSKGQMAIRTYGCSSCHTIPGIRGADAFIGPSLDHLGSRNYIGGVVQNTPKNLIDWVQNPRQIDSKTAMPNLHVSEADARDIASYLYTLR